MAAPVPQPITCTKLGASSIRVNYPNVASETGYEIEYATDAAFTNGFLVTGAVNTTQKDIAGLPAGTRWFVRVRSTSVDGPSEWSNVATAFTDKLAAAVEPAGNTLAAAIIVPQIPLTSLACAQAISGYPVDNLMAESHMLALRASGATIDITFDAGGEAIDTFSLIGTNASDTLTWQIYGGSSLANVSGGTPDFTAFTPARKLRASDGLNQRPSFHSFHRLAAPRTDRWWRIRINCDSAIFEARHLNVGLARVAADRTLSRGLEQTPNSLGEFERRRDTTPNRQQGWVMRQVTFDVEYMLNDEWYEKFADLWWRLGDSQPCLAIPNGKPGKYFHDRMLFGDMSKLGDEMVSSFHVSQSYQINSLI